VTSTSLVQTFINYLLDMTPIVLAGFALYGPTLGLDGATLRLDEGWEPDASAVSLGLALLGMLIGLLRGSRRGSVRLGLGIFCCGFTAVFAGLQLI